MDDLEESPLVNAESGAQRLVPGEHGVERIAQRRDVDRSPDFPEARDVKGRCVTDGLLREEELLLDLRRRERILVRGVRLGGELAVHGS